MYDHPDYRYNWSILPLHNTSTNGTTSTSTETWQDTPFHCRIESHHRTTMVEQESLPLPSPFSSLSSLPLDSSIEPCNRNDTAVKDEDEEEEDTFMCLPHRRKAPVVSSSFQQTKKRLKIQIIIPKVTQPVEPFQPTMIHTPTDHPSKSPFPNVDLFPDNNNNLYNCSNDYDMEQAFLFFAETQEDQDPDVQQFQTKRKKHHLNIQLDQLQQTDERERREIADVIAVQRNEKQALTDGNFERMKLKATVEEQKDLQRLLQMYNDKVASNQRKIDDGIKQLTRRQAQEMHKIAQQHRQQCQQRGMPDHVITAEWQQRISPQIQTKHQQIILGFQTQGENVKKSSDMDYAREQEKIALYHDKRKRDMEHGIQKFVTRLHTNFQQLHQRYLNRHLKRLNTKKDDLVAQLRALEDWSPPLQEEKKKHSQRGTLELQVKKAELKTELHPPRNISSATLPGGTPDLGPRSASLRLNHRRGILGAIYKQLGVEIHNEGLWLSILPKPEETKEAEAASAAKASIPKSKDVNDTEFIPWGFKARNVLYSIICGEIPLGFGVDRFDFGDVIATQGGHIRCVITDLRTGESTASNQRAEAVIAQGEQSVKEFERKALKLTESLAESEKSVTIAETKEKEATTKSELALFDVQKAKKMLFDFRTKYGKFFGPDGQPISSTNASDRQKLVQASTRFKKNIDTAETRHKITQKAATDAKATLLKIQTTLKQTQKVALTAGALFKKRKAMMESAHNGKHVKSKLSEAAGLERATTRVSDTIAAFKQTADRRREHLTQKRSSTNSSTWVQALPGVSGPLKKCLWDKMHRRKVSVVLRPCLDFQLDELKTRIRARSITNSKETSPTRKESEALEAELQAEQLFLLYTNPVAHLSAMPSIPPVSANDPWAEPGSMVSLDVPKDTRPSCLLPRAPIFPVFQNNHAECCSVAGRQLAALIDPSHLKSLSTPLSAVSQAISLAEVNPVITSTVVLAENDPLNISDLAMDTGYSFHWKSSVKSSSQSRRKSSNGADLEVGSKDAGAATIQAENTSLTKALPVIPRSNAVIGTLATVPFPTVPVVVSARTIVTGAAASMPLTPVRRTLSNVQERPPPVQQRVPSCQAIELPTHNLHVEVSPQQSSASAQQMHVARQQAQGLLTQQQAVSLSAYGQMNSQMAATSPPQQATHGQLQQLPPQQFHQQLVPTHTQQYSPQFHQRHQMAQMHMMQQRYPPQMGFFPPMPQAPARQPSFSANNPQTMQQMQAVPQTAVQRRNSQQNPDEQNDPLFMLNDMHPGR